MKCVKLSFTNVLIFYYFDFSPFFEFYSFLSFLPLYLTFPCITFITSHLHTNFYPVRTSCWLYYGVLWLNLNVTVLKLEHKKLFCIAFISRDKNTKILAKENNENNLSINQEFLAILVIVIY